MHSEPGEEILITNRNGEKRSIKDPLRDYYQNILKLDDNEDPKYAVTNIIGELKKGATEGRIIRELSEIYPELRERFYSSERST